MSIGMGRRAAFAACVVLVGLAVGCGSATIGDNGYTGTWTRGNDRSRSTIHIVHDDRGAWFRWSQYTDDDSWIVSCDGWTGSCEQLEKGEQTGSFQFEIWEDQQSGHLMIRCESKFFGPPERENRYVDELLLDETGTKLYSRTVEVDGNPIPAGQGGERTYDKISDEVDGPPPHAGS